ncbi:heme ABC transporter ATP-binding protein [candidate division KSB3 bacterium]|uniref:Heme ABC transporter ATP-binding protein n=1 Tax=candidate division KSB3 bacterium TaxID=2044937 RepID=A0A2G6KAF6_9BACT|nr:MAG: heme ABC transporter ATP-binding protein [candidate division KSB3 bacterium]
MPEAIQHLAMQNIVKRFPGVLACDRISIELRAGEILAILGENGAGKTTLMNVLYGLYHPDAGQILVNGREVKIDTPRQACKLGIGMVHQHFMLVPNLTVVENIALGLYNSSVFHLDLNAARQKILDVSRKYRLAVKPDAYVWQLSVGEQQRVELIKVLCLGANLLVLDEPTAALTPQETNELIALLKEMARQGCSIIFISHKLNEVKALSSHICVLRNGQLVYNGTTSEHSVETLAEKMAGREVKLPVSQEKERYGNEMLSIEDVWAKGGQGTYALQGLSLSVRAGEILGIAGVSGNGQKELADVINGLRHVEKGRILVEGTDITNCTPQQVINQDVGYVPEDRMHEGTIPSFSVRENLIMKDYARPPITRNGFLQQGTISRNAEDLVEKYQIKCPGIQTSCASLSGGNIQKVILARELTRNPRVLIAAYPTRGLDMGAAEYVHYRLLDAREDNKAVLVISEELDELLNICDRIAVIYEGKILQILPRNEADKSSLGLLMAGVTE